MNSELALRGPRETANGTPNPEGKYFILLKLELAVKKATSPATVYGRIPKKGVWELLLVQNSGSFLPETHIIRI
jgi:hypothetical protein